jgi:hypothetical protein
MGNNLISGDPAAVAEVEAAAVAVILVALEHCLPSATHVDPANAE